jgi:glycosyltransferase involved in cell wall biosynthesis
MHLLPGTTAVRLLIYEPDPSGHHFAYVRRLVDAATPLVHRTLLATTSKALASVEFKAFLSDRCGVLEARSIAHGLPLGIAASAAARAAGLLRSIRTLRPDFVYVPYADGVTQLLALVNRFPAAYLLRRVASAALMMRGSFAYPRSSLFSSVQAEATLATLSRAPWNGIDLIDPIAYEYLRHARPHIASRIRLVPDPVEPTPNMSSREARVQLSLPTDALLVGCVGGLDERKGIHLLLQALRQTRLPDDVHLVLAGQLSPPVRQQLESLPGSCLPRRRIHLRDRHIPSAELQTYLVAFNLVCTPYPRHIGSASIVIRAAAACRPVLGSDFGWSGRIIPQFGLGWTCDSRFPSAIAHALERVLPLVETHRPDHAARRFLEFHSEANFRAMFANRIRSHLSLCPEPVLQWASVEPCHLT